MDHYRMITLTLVVSLICSLTAIASEEFVVSTSIGSNIILKTIELDRNRIKTSRSQIIETDHYNFGTAITSRYDKDNLVFDVYYVTCLDPADFECINSTLSMARVDSELSIQFTKDFPIPTYQVSTETIRKPSGYDLRLLLWNGEKLEERKLKKDGSPRRVHQEFSDDGLSGHAVAEDGKMLAATFAADIWTAPFGIEVRTFHPKGPVQQMQSNDLPFGMALSGPLVKILSNTTSAESVARPYRYLFFREFRNLDSSNPQTRIMRQKIDDSTGDFKGQPKSVTKFNDEFYAIGSDSIAVTPEANIILYSQFDASCKKVVLMAQVFDPQSSKNVGLPQVLIGCSEVDGDFPIVRGIDIAPVRSKLP
jgi:hypothetical protein